MGSFRAYVTGFIASLFLTLMAFYVVWQQTQGRGQTFSAEFMVFIIVGLALIQLAVQLVFFLHLGKESKPRWNLVVFLFAVLVVGIVVFGSLWIMQNLNYHMHPSESEIFLFKDEGFDQ